MGNSPFHFPTPPNKQRPAPLSMNAWINWGKKVEGAQGNSSPFFFIAINFDKDSTVSPILFIYLFFPPWRALCQAALFLFTMVLPWNPPGMFQNHRFSWKLLLPSATTPFVTSGTMKRGAGGHRSDHKTLQKCTHSHPNHAPTAQHHKNPTGTLQKSFSHLHHNLKIHAKYHNPLCTASFLSTLMLGKKPISPHTTGGLVLKEVFKWK